MIEMQPQIARLSYGAGAMLRAPSRARSSAVVIIAIAVTFLTVFVVLPLVVVFAQAFSQGRSAPISRRWRSRKRCPPSG